jgi:hypothetical protein
MELTKALPIPPTPFTPHRPKPKELVFDHVGGMAVIPYLAVRSFLSAKTATPRLIHAAVRR